MTDESIIEMYFMRNEEAIRHSEEKYGKYCFAVANNILSNSGDSEECVNDTWLRSWNAIPPQRPTVLKLFFARITRNLAIGKYRSNNAKKRGSGEIGDVLHELEYCIADSDAESKLNATELARAVNEFLGTLEPRDRAVFLRRYFFTESTDTIALNFGLKKSNVLKILSRIRKKLKTYLTEEGFFV